MCKGSIKGQAMSLLREILMHRAPYNIERHWVWIPRQDTALPDALSQYHNDIIAILCPQLHLKYIQLPTKGYTPGTRTATSPTWPHDISAEDSAPRLCPPKPHQEITLSTAAESQELCTSHRRNSRCHSGPPITASETHAQQRSTASSQG